MFNLQPSDKIGLLGMSGSGKTYLMSYLIKNYFKNVKKYVIDPVGYFSIIKDVYQVGKSQLKNEYKDCNLTALRFNNPDSLDNLCWVFNRYNKPMVLFIDEINNYISINPYIPQHLKIYVNSGRNFNHGLVYSTQRIGLLNNNVFSNTNYIFYFKLGNTNDLRELNNLLPFDFFKLDNTLDKNKHNFYLIDKNNNELYGIYSI